MAKASPIITAFNSGEFSPLMAGRVDLKYYTSACRRLRNFIITPQGPARRRPGTRFVAEVKNSASRTWLARFEFNITQAYVVECGNFYFRFFSNHGVVGAPVEVVTPYSAADLTDADGMFALQFVQSNDVLYVVHNKYPPYKLVRTGSATFTFNPVAFDCGPFKDVDPTQAVTVYASANTGAGITLTASAPIFLAGHVGTDFYLEQSVADAILQWEPGGAVLLNDVRRSNGSNYHALNAATTGSIRPIHTAGAKFDGNAGVQWQFDDPGYGWATITAIGGGGTTAAATVVSRLPDMAVGNTHPSNRWAFEAWSSVEGYPDCVTFYKNRLCFARGQDGWCSVSADFENFRRKDDGGNITLDMALVFTITSDRANKIEWLAPSNHAMAVGTAGDEHVVSENTSTQAFGPGNAQAKKQTEYGSRRVTVCRVGDGVLFIQKAGRKIRDQRMAENSIVEKWVSADVTVLAEHMTKGGVVDMSYQQEPDSVVWCARKDGRLLGLTLNREQDIRGWHQHRLGGYSDIYQRKYAIVEAVASIPSPDGDRDELWLIVRRWINGSIKRYVEYMEQHHEEGDDSEDSFYLDSGLSLDNSIALSLQPGVGADVVGTTNVPFITGGAYWVAGDVGKYIHYRYFVTEVTGKITWHKGVAQITGYDGNTQVRGTILSVWPNLDLIPAGGWRKTVTAITGLGHLEGQTVQVLGDGAAQPDALVTGGSITLSQPCSKVHAGLGATAVLQPMPLEAGAQDGTAQGKTQRIARCFLRFHETLGARYGRDEDAQLDRIETRGGGDNMNEPPNLFTGDKLVSWPSGYDAPALITIVQDQPLPCTVVALMPQIVTQDNR